MSRGATRGSTGAGKVDMKVEMVYLSDKRTRTRCCWRRQRASPIPKLRVLRPPSHLHKENDTHRNINEIDF